MKRTIFFDLGNVLIFFDHLKMCRQTADYCGLPLEKVQEFLLGYLDPYERGSIDSQTIFEQLAKMSPHPLEFSQLMHAVSDIFEPNLPTIAIATKLKEQGHRLFLLSNTCEAHFNFVLAQFPFLKNFDGCVLSYAEGARKPEKKIYEKALKIAGCRNEECFYVDDILPYIESARSMNIDAEQYTDPQTLIQHLQDRGIL